uniref:Uncharacterized protein n=1 Tax=Glossina palpalis gambiensis TaxID=67801 RepID=A0A1B0AWU2_9MUSC
MKKFHFMYSAINKALGQGTSAGSFRASHDENDHHCDHYDYSGRSLQDDDSIELFKRKIIANIGGVVPKIVGLSGLYHLFIPDVEMENGSRKFVAATKLLQQHNYFFNT